MSLADTIVRTAAAAYNVIHADVWTVLSGTYAGQTFLGDAQTESQIVLDTELGQDAREKTVLYVDRPVLPLTRGTQIRGKGYLWTLAGNVDDNPANDRVKFELIKISAGKDT